MRMWEEIELWKTRAASISCWNDVNISEPLTLTSETTVNFQCYKVKSKF